jgi:hypothetical protein
MWRVRLSSDAWLHPDAFAQEFTYSGLRTAEINKSATADLLLVPSSALRQKLHIDNMGN